MSTLKNPVSSIPPFPVGLPVGPAPEAYQLTDLGVLADESPLLPVALNDHGELAVHTEAPVYEPDSWKVQGFLLRHGRRTHTGIPPGRTPLAGLSRTGLLCGAARRRGATLHAWASHLGCFGADFWPDHESFCAGVNADGFVTGHVLAPAETGGTSRRVFLISPSGQVRQLTPPWGGEVSAAAVNDAGAVLLNSTSNAAPTGGTQTWLWSDGCFQLVENIGCDTWGVALTPEGRVAGHALTPFGERHAILWSQGRTYDLNPSGEHESEALAANDQGVVVGRVFDLQGVSRAFRWTPAEGMRPLGELVPDAVGWVLQKATCLNAGGQIAGVGTAAGRRRGFLLTPAA